MSIHTRRKKKGLDSHRLPLFVSLLFLVFPLHSLPNPNSTLSFSPLLLLPPLDPAPTLHSSPHFLIFYNPLVNVHTNVHARTHTHRRTYHPYLRQPPLRTLSSYRALLNFFFSALRSILFFFLCLFFYFFFRLFPVYSATLLFSGRQRYFDTQQFFHGRHLASRLRLESGHHLL